MYVDRAKDLISRGGYKISAVEIESLLLAHSKVAEVAVVGMPDPLLGEQVCVFDSLRAPPMIRPISTNLWESSPNGMSPSSNGPNG